MTKSRRTDPGPTKLPILSRHLASRGAEAGLLETLTCRSAREGLRPEMQAEMSCPGRKKNQEPLKNRWSHAEREYTQITMKRSKASWRWRERTRELAELEDASPRSPNCRRAAHKADGQLKKLKKCRDERRGHRCATTSHWMLSILGVNRRYIGSGPRRERPRRRPRRSREGQELHRRILAGSHAAAKLKGPIPCLSPAGGARHP